MNGQDLYEGAAICGPGFAGRGRGAGEAAQAAAVSAVGGVFVPAAGGDGGAVLHSVEIRMLDVEHPEDYQDAPGMKKNH